MELVTLDAIRAAETRLREVVPNSTPVERSRVVSDRVGADVLLKCENLQRTGSFKIRGAFNRIALLSDEERARGVVCASAGNHAQGVALAASWLDVAATVFMPENAPIPKLNATTAYGADVRLEGVVFDEALHAAMSFAEAEGRVFVHPFDHPDIIAGQGTLGLEIAAQAPEVDTVLIPIGGGGLISGTAVALKELRDGIRVIGVQASGAASFPRALRSGRAEALPKVDTIADGIAVKRPGELTLAHVRELVDEVVTVDDAAISRALVLLLERAKLVVEPSGAVAVAAILEGAVDTGSSTLAVLSGGNIDPLVLQHLVTSGLTAEGRYTTLRTRIADRPGNLHRVLGILADERANVLSVEHHRFGRRLKLGQVEVVVELETRGPEHIAHLKDVLQREGYPAASL